MDCRITSTSRQRRARSGLTLLELMIATLISTVLSTGLAALVFYSNRSMAAMANYVDLNHRSQFALDRMSKDIRQARRVISYNATSLTIEAGDGETLVFAYNPDARTLTRTKNGVTDDQPLLTECDSLRFSTYQRNSIAGTYDQFLNSSATSCKLVQLNWVCSRQIRGSKVNTESVQSAKIVIRKQ